MCYLTGIFYAVVRQISMLFIDNKISVFLTVRSLLTCSQVIISAYNTISQSALADATLHTFDLRQLDEILHGLIERFAKNQGHHVNHATTSKR